MLTEEIVKNRVATNHTKFEESNSQLAVPSLPPITQSCTNTAAVCASSTSSYSSATTNNNPEIQNAVVVMCRVCREVFGDTCSLILLDAVTETFTLSRMINVKKDESQLNTCLDKSAHDFGCTYLTLQCASCSEWIGKSYVTTTPSLDLLRGHYTVTSSKCKFYEIAGDELYNRLQRQENNGQGIVETTDGGGLSKREIADLKIEITKLQRFCVALAQKSASEQALEMKKKRRRSSNVVEQ